MFDALAKHDGMVSILDRTILSVGFPMTLMLFLRISKNLESQMISLDKIGKRYKIEVSADKTSETKDEPDALPLHKHLLYACETGNIDLEARFR